MYKDVHHKIVENTAPQRAVTHTVYKVNTYNKTNTDIRSYIVDL